MADPRGSDPPLIKASRQGDASTAVHLLRAGAEVGVCDADGRTALHHATAGGHVECAASLLAYGALPDVRDAMGQRALDPPTMSVDVLHAIRQRYHRIHRADDQPGAVSAGVEWCRSELERHGIVRLPGFVERESLTAMRAEFERFILGLRHKLARGDGVKKHYFEEEHWWPAERAFISNNAFNHSAQLLRFICRPEILAVARLYLGRPPVIQRAVAMRYLAGSAAERDMFTWHHDLEDRRLKVMVLLSDVGPGDQHLSYVCGSQALFHPYDMFLENDCGLEYCRERLGRLEIYDAIGQAGDVFLFDSNGAHRGNRRATGRLRDVYLVELNASGASLWGGDLDARVLAEVRPDPDPFTGFLTAEKKWNAPKPAAPSWVATLADVSAWL